MFVSLKILLVPVTAGTHDLHPAEHHLVRPVPDQRGGGPAVGHVVLQVGAVSPGYVMLHVIVELFIVFCISLLYYCIVLQPEEAHPVPAAQVAPLININGVDEEHVLPGVVRTSIHKPDRKNILI